MVSTARSDSGLADVVEQPPPSPKLENPVAIGSLDAVGAANSATAASSRFDETSLASSTTQPAAGTSRAPVPAKPTDFHDAVNAVSNNKILLCFMLLY